MMLVRTVAERALPFDPLVPNFRAFGLDTGGRGSKLFRERFQRIANLALRIEETDAHQRTVRRLFLIPTSRELIEFFTGRGVDPRRKLLTYRRYGFRLDRTFWRYLKTSRIPTPLRLLRAFHDGPRA